MVSLRCASIWLVGCLAVLTPVLWLTGCACKTAPCAAKEPLAPCPAVRQGEFNTQLEALNRNQKSLKTFSASLMMSVSKDNSHSFSKSFRCQLVCELPDKLRIKGHVGGTVPAFDLLIRHWRVKLFLPTRNELVEGLRVRLKDEPIMENYSIGPLLNTELAYLFVPMLPEKDTFWEATDEGAWLYQDGSEDGRWMRTLLDRTTFLPVRQEIFDGSGQRLIELEFRDYRQIEQAQCPFDITLTSKTDGYQVKMKITSLKPNVALAGGAFSIRVPDGVTKIAPEELDHKIQKAPDS